MAKKLCLNKQHIKINKRFNLFLRKYSTTPFLHMSMDLS